MPSGSITSSVLALPERFVPDRADGLTARFRLRVGSLTRDVVVVDKTCKVESASGKPDVTISTSPSAWLEIDAGRLSGVEAFAQRRLTMNGSIERALIFEPLFRRERAGAMRYAMEMVPVNGMRISAMVAGPENAEPLLLLHGLGATKASLLTIVPALARHHRVIAVDLPGYGASSKPRGRYDAPWFAEHMFSLLDELGIERVRVAGNSMGGRISQEMALMTPERVEAIALMCPATAFGHRPGLALVKVLRPELGVVAGYLPKSRIKATMRSLFANPARIEEAWYEAASNDFLKVWRSPRARLAFFTSARNIYLDEPYGETGFFTRLENLGCRALYIYGEQDPLITPAFGKKISSLVPEARVEVWDDCGHVPQLEHPERTAETILDFFGTVPAAAAAAG